MIKWIVKLIIIIIEAGTVKGSTWKIGSQQNFKLVARVLIIREWLLSENVYLNINNIWGANTPRDEHMLWIHNYLCIFPVPPLCLYFKNSVGEQLRFSLKVIEATVILLVWSIQQVWVYLPLKFLGTAAVTCKVNLGNFLLDGTRSGVIERPQGLWYANPLVWGSEA